MKRRKEEIEHTELLNGILASAIVNFSMGAPKKPTTPSQFMPSQWGQQPEKKPRRTRKQIASQIGTFMKAQMIVHNK